MSPTDPYRRAQVWLTHLRSTGFGRGVAVCLGLGLGTAFAADAVTLAIPESALTTAADDTVVSPNWRLFDPGFLVDHLPFKISVGQTISYNDNVQNLPASGPVALAGLGSIRSRGDFYSDTTVSIASRFPMGAQTFFFNGTYAPTRYFTDTTLDADNYNVNGGVDFNIDNRCSGRLIGSFLNAQTALDETAGLGVQNTMTTSFNESARCTLSGHVDGLLNSGVSRSEIVATPALPDRVCHLR